jgi:hypothetical protein
MPGRSGHANARVCVVPNVKKFAQVACLALYLIVAEERKKRSTFFPPTSTHASLKNACFTHLTHLQGICTPRAILRLVLAGRDITRVFLGSRHACTGSYPYASPLCTC